MRLFPESSPSQHSIKTLHIVSNNERGMDTSVSASTFGSWMLEAAVVAKEDDEALVKPQAFVVLNQGIEGDGLFVELKEHVKSSIGAWKKPRTSDSKAFQSSSEH